MKKQTRSEAKELGETYHLLVKLGHSRSGAKVGALCLALLLFSVVGLIAQPLGVHATGQGPLKRRPGPPTFFPLTPIFTPPGRGGQPTPTDTPIPPTVVPTDTPIPPTVVPTDTPISSTPAPTDTPISSTPTNTSVPTATPTKATGIFPIGSTPAANGKDFATPPPDIPPTPVADAHGTSNSGNGTSQDNTNASHSKDGKDMTMISILLTFSIGILLMLVAGGSLCWHIYRRKRQGALSVFPSVSSTQGGWNELPHSAGSGASYGQRYGDSWQPDTVPILTQVPLDGSYQASPYNGSNNFNPSWDYHGPSGDKDEHH